MTLDSPGTNEPLTVDTIIRDYLSYQDAADLSPDVRERGLRDSLASESARTYAGALKGLFERDGVQPVRRLANEMKDAMTREATRISIPVSPYGKSPTWAFWDIAKQYHFFTHQAENDARYVIADPMLDRDKQREIVNRHIGWEGRQAFVANSWPQFAAMQDRESVLELLQKPPKANNDLSSADLAVLGQRLRALRVPAPAEAQPAPTQQQQPQNVPERTPVQRNEPSVPTVPRVERRTSVPPVHASSGAEKTPEKKGPSFIRSLLGAGIVSMLSSIGDFFRFLTDLGRELYPKIEAGLAKFWSVLVSSLQHPMGAAPKASSAPAAEKAHPKH